ncbi:MAG: biotin carboxylase N-terminal domain-containing protein [Acidobacteriota bacterium]
MTSPRQAGEFRKVLVANRGEIARRIFRTLREMGLETVAVFSDADRAAPHVAEADEAVHLGPAPAAKSYLDQAAMIAAAQAVGADAIHPGYGFLAENAEFAERCAAAGLAFIGPSPEAIRLMGNKGAAKALAVEVGVPVLEGFAVAGLDEAESRNRAEKLGFPILIKATAGGGGKGMRTVSDASLLAEALAAAAREAEAAFGDGALLIERLLSAARHVEVQVFGDAHGNVVHLFERDCSLQRRHQKVFEESPSPAVDAQLRARMGEAAVMLARAVEYRGAGTVEFLLAANGEFFFLEMNTRLQVEHPVTEAVTGLDLVRLQVEVAQGLPLSFEQDRAALSGHAIEARLYAEDPANEFLPVTGTVALWSVPDLPGLRVDSGIEQGSEIGVHYDPMLAKVIAHGRDRGEALRRLHRGLQQLAIGGLVTNLDFLLAVLEQEAFRRGDVDTAFLERDLPVASRTRPIARDALALHAIAATLHLFRRRRRRSSPIPRGIPPGWHHHRPRFEEQMFDHAQGRLAVRYVAHAIDRFTIDLVDLGTPAGAKEAWPEHQSLVVRLVLCSRGELVAEVQGVRRRFRIGSPAASRRLTIHGLGQVSELQVVSRFPEGQTAAVAGGCVAPMTGRVIEVAVKQGDHVEAGSTLVVLEAMKMEHRLQAQADGIVQEIHVGAGQMVDPDEILVLVVPLEA